jgi:dephospho-CoA kinase
MKARSASRYILGIAGYIGSGKTTVARLFEKKGAYFIDADKVVDTLYRPGHEGYKRIIDFFGEPFMTKKGLLNRKKLTRSIFNDPKKLKILHALIHPLVTTEIQKLIDQSQAPLVVIEATYFEKKFLKRLVSKIVWVDCPKELAFKRLASSRHMSRELFEKILRVQVKPPQIDFVIKNDGSLKSLNAKITKIINSRIL